MGDGEIPADQRNACLTDAETAAATAFVYYSMVNAFQGRLAETLSLLPCLRILKDLQVQGALPPPAHLYAGDTVMVGQPDRSGWQARSHGPTRCPAIPHPLGFLVRRLPPVGP